MAEADPAKRRRNKALGYLRDGRVSVMALYAARAGTVAEVIVRGHFTDHLLEADGVAWTCHACPEGDGGPIPCAHALAADMVCHVVVPLSDTKR